MLSRSELKSFLRQFDFLRGIDVVHENDVKASLAPQVVLLTGVVSVSGEPHWFETEINLNEFQSVDDLMRLVGSIKVAFEKAGVEQLGT